MPQLTFPKAKRLRVVMTGIGGFLVLLIGIVGFVSTQQIFSVAAGIRLINERTGPLYTDALRASAAMQQINSIARNLIDECFHRTGSEVERAAFALRNADFSDIEAFRRHAQRVQLEELGRSLQMAKAELQGVHREILAVCEDYQVNREARVGIEQRIEFSLTRFEVSINALMEQSSHTIAGELDTAERAFRSVTGMENELARLGTILVGDWPLLRGAYDLRLQARKLRDSLLGDSYPQSTAGVTPVVEEQLEALTALRRELRNVSPWLESRGMGARVRHIQSILGAISTDLTDVHGLRENLLQGAQIDTRMQSTARQLRLSEYRLTKILQKLAIWAKLQNQASTEEITRKIDHSVPAILGAVSFAALACIGAVLAFSLLVTRPIEHLTAHVRRLRAEGRSESELPQSLLTRPDEIGSLATSFDGLMRTLDQARLDLLAASRVEVQQQFDRLTSAVESIPQGVLLTGPDERIILANDNFRELFGLSVADVRPGTSLQQVIDRCRENGAVVLADDTERGAGVTPHFFLSSQRIVSMKGERTIVVTTALTPEGGTVAVHEDVTERKRQEERIAYLAHHDALTGLPNRVLFRDQIGEALAHCLASGDPSALLYLDLDQFKTVNDTLGHPIGDRLLVAVAERLRQALGERDHVARLGGDEFAILLAGRTDGHRAAEIADQIIAAIGQPFDIGGQFIFIGVSIGIAIAPADGEDADLLMKHADMALYRAKQDGRNIHRFFEPSMDSAIKARRELEIDLRQALANDEFRLHFQPLFNLQDGQIEGFEALLRWPHPRHGNVSPAEFIPVAEETGLISAIGTWVLRHACQEAARWPKDTRVAVNVSPVQFRTRTLVLDVIAALGASGLSPNRLEIEITEGVLLHDTDATLSILADLQRLGVRIAMDDFGTGYSSLSYLRKFRFDKVKIDRAFIQDIHKGQDKLAVVRAVTGLCTSLGIATTAEGVESEEQLLALKAEGCTQAQGFYTGRPMPAEQALALLHQQEVMGMSVQSFGAPSAVSA
ncbi:EAL domain-containing protein [Microvirga tunisiensis]|uniref:EAL domain-containing protein n=2 Tax=Pannonibacter tanglangensis TaxID=2750084 RepID=A0ABW9ZH85_9HYPH|nr:MULTISPECIES: EAL domain-containing protein [unclassified Pannonibacter]NBN63403.1 EAL domain-containing protein [Pannonibacter sp. XCT-34]NBN77038.1 EAL domain-containing protein [Pannonibacter sp. XCT-53]